MKDYGKILEDRAKKYLNGIGEDLSVFTKNCRIDMHEPDEQEITASVVGNIFDNAFGEDIDIKQIISGVQELVVTLKHPEMGYFKINLATLTALARIGAKYLKEEIGIDK